jgi:hypothetical protein
VSITAGSTTAQLLSQMSLVASSPYTAQKDPYTGKTTYVYNAPAPISIDSSTLTSLLSEGITGTSSSSSNATSSSATAVAPWQSASTAPQQSALVQSVTNGAPFFTSTSAALAAPAGAHQQDYESLFGLYQGLNAMQGLAAAAASPTATSTQQAAYQTTFAQGLTQLQGYLANAPFQTIDVSTGVVAASEQSTQGATVESQNYTTKPLAIGSSNTPVTAFSGPVAFSMQVASLNGTTKNVAFNLDDMGSTPRTIGNVVNYLNSQLSAAKVETRFADVMNPGAVQTAQINGATQTLNTDANTYSLQIVGSTGETISLSAADSTPAVYLTGAQGAPGKTTTTVTPSSTGGSTVTTSTGPSDVIQNLAKYNGGSDAVATSPGDGVVSNTTIANSPTNVRATATGPDGSVYVLADIAGTTADGQTINGASDTALMKYDSAGALQYTRTLGAANAASGYAIAVSPDGSQVAITGTTTGPLDATTSSQSSSATTGFVSVYSTANGDEQWSQSQSQPEGTTQTPTAITFGSNGQVFVAGKATGQLIGSGSASGTQSSYIQGYSGKQITAADGTISWASSSTFTSQFGSGGTNTPTGVAVSGNTLYEAGMENGDAVVRAYTLQSSGAPTLAETENLGALKGGSVAGISVASDGSVIVAGSTENGALAGTVGQAYTGGEQGFVATLSANLTPNTLNYVPTPANFAATSMTTSGGNVYLAGSLAQAAQSGQTTGSAGYVAEVDPTSGQVLWSRTQQGVDGIDTPTSVAVSTTGASSSLDALGLPTGAVNFTQSANVIAASSVRAGDQFQVQVGSGPPTTITINENDTFATLAQSINFATGYQATATTSTVNGKTVLNIAPTNSNNVIKLIPGTAGQDALAPLGLRPGVLTDDANNTTASGAAEKSSASQRSTLGLVLPDTMDISTTAGAKAASTALQLSIAKVENLYQDMITPPVTTPTSNQQPLSATLSTYYSNQLANYQLALQRLGGN